MDTNTTYQALEAEWFEAVKVRDEHDRRVRRVIDSIPATCVAGREQVRRSEGARRSHMTRRIVRAEQALDAMRV